MNGAPVLEVLGLGRRFGAVRAPERVDLELGAGETALLLGANGTGKTTLLRMIAGLLPPSEGEVRVGGLSPRRDGAEARRRIGFLSHAPGLYPELTAAENLRFFARLYGAREHGARVAGLLEESGLAGWEEEPVRSFSRGMIQRLALARVFLHDPDLLLLDEPFTGLDRRGTEALADRLARRAAAGGTALLATHRIDAAARLGDRAVILRKRRPARIVDLSGAGEEGRVSALRSALEEDA
ncbi:MAG: heme ABC exporter ATP-binding protein CcmA [Candidatus Eisenbacteria bacterium]|nr:heme ABC exporter ATP-binding protein CcmA [Candidatus Eisenbacteria bacterium]